MLDDKKSERIIKVDYCRVLVTETAPYETPIIFSNDGFYNIAKKQASSTGFAKTIESLFITSKG
jgi:hypothetical protein